jgi:hypothetical protein
MELPYESVDDAMWELTCVVSWRWAIMKPEKPPAHDFSIMQPGQFEELMRLLRHAHEAGIKYTWIDW